MWPAFLGACMPRQAPHLSQPAFLNQALSIVSWQEVSPTSRTLAKPGKCVRRQCYRGGKISLAGQQICCATGLTAGRRLRELSLCASSVCCGYGQRRGQRKRRSPAAARGAQLVLDFNNPGAGKQVCKMTAKRLCLSNAQFTAQTWLDCGCAEQASQARQADSGAACAPCESRAQHELMPTQCASSLLSCRWQASFIYVL